DYNDLMEILKEMIVSRFKEIDESHFALPQWENTKESCRTLIHEKKCSMLVIYHDDKPIDITLSYHFNGIFYSGISSFDIDYSKFGLGHISIYKELEWALDNDYKFFDLTYGGNTYKKLWSNCDYLFENHIFGKKKSISGLLVFTVSILYVQLKKLLKKLNVHLLYLYLKNSLSPKKNQKNKSLSPKMEYSVEHFSCPIDPALKLDFENIDISSKTSGIVLRPIYDFLYVNQEKYNNITLAKQNLQNNSFYILGEKKWAKVSTNNEKI
ncbi:MAG: GNAT family N-acetyltransferase, partial [Flavobacteriaceae bacterium]